MLRSNLHQLLCIGFCGGFFSNFACQASSLLEEISWALAVCGGRELACPWCFTSSVAAWCWCCLLPGPSLPRHAWLCWGNPEFHFLFLHCLSRGSPAPRRREVSQPWAVASVPASCQLWRHQAASLRQVQTFPCSSVTCHVLHIRHHLL